MEDPRLRTVLGGRYRVLRRLGEGGMGVVYAGEDERLSRKVAIKCLLPAFAMDAEVVGRFRREATATGKIGDEHIVDVRDIDRLPDGTLYMVQELLDGTSLSDAIGGTPMPLGRAVHILEHVCDGLRAAHAAGIVHRDLKPENVFLVKRGSDPDYAKILDFGISKFLDAEGAPGGVRTRTGTALGTPYYMAPEQAMGRKDVDHRADLWALGVMLFRMLTARYPFESDAYPALMMMICHEPAPPLRSIRPELPEGIEKLIERLLAKDRDARFASAAEVKSALAPWRGSPGAAVDPLASTDAAAASATVTEPVRPARPIGVFVVAGGVAIAAITAVLLGGTGDEDAQVTAPDPAAPAIAAEPDPPEPVRAPPALAVEPVAPIALTRDAGAITSTPARRPGKVVARTQETAAITPSPPTPEPVGEVRDPTPSVVEPTPPVERPMEGVVTPLAPSKTIRSLRRRDAGR